jgi:hypothetical protein
MEDGGVKRQMDETELDSDEDSSEEITIDVEEYSHIEEEEISEVIQINMVNPTEKILDVIKMQNSACEVTQISEHKEQKLSKLSEVKYEEISNGEETKKKFFARVHLGCMDLSIKFSDIIYIPCPSTVVKGQSQADLNSSVFHQSEDLLYFPENSDEYIKHLQRSTKVVLAASTVQLLIFRLIIQKLDFDPKDAKFSISLITYFLTGIFLVCNLTKFKKSSKIFKIFAFIFFKLLWVTNLTFHGLYFWVDDLKNEKRGYLGADMIAISFLAKIGTFAIFEIMVKTGWEYQQKAENPKIRNGLVLWKLMLSSYMGGMIFGLIGTCADIGNFGDKITWGWSQTWGVMVSLIIWPLLAIIEVLDVMDYSDEYKPLHGLESEICWDKSIFVATMASLSFLARLSRIVKTFLGQKDKLIGLEMNSQDEIELSNQVQINDSIELSKEQSIEDNLVDSK